LSGKGNRGKPFLEPGGGTKCLRVYFSETGHPINGGAICDAVQANALMSLGRTVLRLASEPEDSAILGAFRFNESTFMSCGLKSLECIHGAFSMRLFPAVYSNSHHRFKRIALKS
jgi:hypothetical protein